jgi:hypothetical protein
MSAPVMVRSQRLLYAHDEHIDLAQQISLYESNASWLQRAQKKFLGKTVVGSELHILVLVVLIGKRHMYSASSLSSSASGAALGSAAGLAMVRSYEFATSGKAAV